MFRDIVAQHAPQFLLPQIDGGDQQGAGGGHWYTPEGGLQPEAMYDQNGTPLNSMSSGGQRQFYVPQGATPSATPPSPPATAPRAQPRHTAPRHPIEDAPNNPVDLMRRPVGGSNTGMRAAGMNAEQDPNTGTLNIDVFPLDPSNTEYASNGDIAPRPIQGLRGMNEDLAPDTGNNRSPVYNGPSAHVAIPPESPTAGMPHAGPLASGTTPQVRGQTQQVPMTPIPSAQERARIESIMRRPDGSNRTMGEIMEAAGIKLPVAKAPQFSTDKTVAPNPSVPEPQGTPRRMRAPTPNSRGPQVVEVNTPTRHPHRTDANTIHESPGHHPEATQGLGYGPPAVINAPPGVSVRYLQPSLSARRAAAVRPFRNGARPQRPS